MLPCPALVGVPQHGEDEYGAAVDGEGRHSGGPFQIQVSPKMRVEELRKVIRVRRWQQQGYFVNAASGRLLVRALSLRAAAAAAGGSHLAGCAAPQDVGGIVPALQRLSFAGKNLEDSQRTLEQ